MRSPDELRWFPDAIPAVRRLAARFELFIVTHQGGVGLGVLSASDVEKVHRHLAAELAAAGVPIREIFTCPHRRDEGCDCIKPSPRFLLDAARRYDLDLSRSFVVGDHPHDVEMAARAGGRGLYVRSGHGERHLDELPPGVIVVPGIREAVDWILGEDEMRRRLGDPEAALGRAADALRDGGVVVFPTETVYGLGANAFDARAVARVFDIKARPHFDPLIVHVRDATAAADVVRAMPAAAVRLMKKFWPGPLTLVLPKSDRVPDLVTAGLASVAVRCPRHPVAWALLHRVDFPLAAPSANRFGCVSPTTAEAAVEQVGERVDALLDGGPCPVGIESTIVSLVDDAPVLLRPGGLPAEEIEAVIGPLRTAPPAGARPLAPGALPRHYAPATPLQLRADDDVPPPGKRIGLVRLRPSGQAEGFAAVESLSPTGDLREAAANLFAALRRLDGLRLEAIWAEMAPETGLGRAINDRLRRAAASSSGGG